MLGILLNTSAVAILLIMVLIIIGISDNISHKLGDNNAK